jgi:serine/threonine-protein kinase
MPPTTPAPTTPGTVPGDLGIPGTPMAQLPCDGTYVTFLASVKNTTASAMQEALASFPGSQYLRTDQTCPSLNAPASDGAPLYRIFAGPYGDVNEACAARAMSSQGAFVKRVSNGDPPAHVVTCP